MKKVLLCFIVFCSTVCCSWVHAEKTKQALRALEKGDYEKVEEILTKSMRKDTLNPGTSYVWAILYSNQDYPGYHLDTAHLHIKDACEWIKLQNEDHLDELEDADIFEYDIKNKKIAIDSMAYVRAEESDQIEGYEHFINDYADAADFDQAVSRRNQLVFAKVEGVHTWQAYDDFMTAYPEAVQVEKAKIQYDKLIYEERTRSGKIEDLKNFLIQEPLTPYRHSIEKRIFEDHIGTLDPEKLIDFLNSYQNEVLSLRTLNLLYHMDGFDFSTVSNAYDVHLNYLDSVDRIETLSGEPLIVYNKDSKFRFLTLEGKTFLKDSYDQVSLTYACGNIIDDLLEVGEVNKKKLINREGVIVFEGYSGEVRDLGNGLLAIEENEKIGLIHKSGFRLLPPSYDDLELLESSLLVFKKEGKAGVMTITGKEVVSPSYDDISLIGNFWVFESNGLFGVTRVEKVKNALNGSFTLELPYEEVELINDQYIIGFTESGEALINRQLEVLTPLGTKRINTRHETWVVELADGYTTFDPDLGKLSANVYQHVLQNTEWLGLTRNGKWFVYNKNIYDEPIIGVDSLKLLGEDIAIVFRGSAGMAIFPNKKVVEIVEDQFLKSIGPEIRTDTHYLVVKEGEENILYKDGVEQFRVVCEELEYISDSAFSVKKGGKYGAVGLDGRLIMRIRYDAISQSENGVAAVLYKGHFGAYNFRERVLLRMDYEEKIKPYNEQLFVVRKDGKYGLLSRLNEVLIEPEFDQINYWSDSTILGKREGKWEIVDIAGGNLLLTGVHYFEYLKDTPDEKILLIKKDDGYGVFHSEEGVIIPTVFHDVMNLGNQDKQLYFTETAVPEADIYVVVYYDGMGTKLFSEAYRGRTYSNLVCED